MGVEGRSGCIGSIGGPISAGELLLFVGHDSWRFLMFEKKYAAVPLHLTFGGYTLQLWPGYTVLGFLYLN